MSVRFESLGVYLPPRRLSTEDALAGCASPSVVGFPLESLTGIRSRPVADGEFAIDLAERALERCLARSAHAPEDVDLLLCCNVSRLDGPDRVSYEPTTAVRLKGRLGFRNARALDLSNACAGVWTGILLARAHLDQGLARTALVVSGEYLSHLTATAQREIEGPLDDRVACLTLGDAGIAVLLDGHGQGAGLVDLDLTSFAAYSRYCVAGPSDGAHGGAIMRSDPIALTSAAFECGLGHALDRADVLGFDWDSFDHLLLHQTSRRSVIDFGRELCASLGDADADRSKVLVNVEERGNTATTTHFVALHDGIVRGDIRSHDRVAFGISGSGLTIGTAFYDLDDLPDRLLAGADRPPARRAAPANGRRPPRRAGRLEVVARASVPPRDGGRALDLAREAAERCLARSPIPRERLRFVVHAGTYRDDFVCEPAFAAFLAEDLGINPSLESPGRTLAFDLASGAVGFLAACDAVWTLLADEPGSAALVVAAETENNHALPPEDRRGVAASASAAVVRLGPADGPGFERFHFRDFPEHAGLVEAWADIAPGARRLRHRRGDRADATLARCVAATLAELSSSSAGALGEVDLVLPPLGSPALLEELTRAVDLGAARWVGSDAPPGGSLGDVHTSSFVHALDAADARGELMPGRTACALAVGSGVQVGLALYRF